MLEGEGIGGNRNIPRNRMDLTTRALLATTDGTRIVITGDSLSYNRYDFETEARLNAYDCLPGIRSWSFLLRDAIHRNDRWFQHGDEVSFSHKKSTSRFSLGNRSDYLFPFENRVLTGRIRERDEGLVIRYFHHNETNKAVLHFGRVPGTHSARFDIHVDGTYIRTVDNNGTGRHYQGLEPFCVELPALAGERHEILLANWQSSEGEPLTDACTMHLLGIGSKYTPIYLTGQGGRTASWIRDNLHSRVTFCRPHLVILIIGANDRISRTVEQFARDLRAIVAEIRLVVPDARILLLSPPPSSMTSTEREYDTCMEDIALASGCYYLDLYALFAPLPVEKWRFDDVHLNRCGNKLLFEAVSQLFGLEGP